MDFATFFRIIYGVTILLMLAVVVCASISQYYLTQCVSKSIISNSGGSTEFSDTRCYNTVQKNKVVLALSVCLLIALIVFGLCWFFIRTPPLSVTNRATV